MQEPGKYLEVQWLGKAGQGALTAASVLAEILAMQGKYVQAFPDFHMEKRAPSVSAYNRFSDVPVKLHARVRHAGIVMVMEPTLILSPGLGDNAAEGAAYIVNTSYEPDYVKEKMSLPPGSLYTLDASSIAREETGKAIPNIPMMAVFLRLNQWLTVEDFKTHLGQALAAQWRDNPDVVAVNLKTVDRALRDVQKLEDEQE